MNVSQPVTPIRGLCRRAETKLESNQERGPDIRRMARGYGSWTQHFLQPTASAESEFRLRSGKASKGKEGIGEKAEDASVAGFGGAGSRTRTDGGTGSTAVAAKSRNQLFGAFD
jgi:hypothetical protein